MTSSYVYANSIAAAKESKLISAEKLARLIDAKSGLDGLKILNEFSFGDGTVQDPYLFENLIEQEMSNLFKLIEDTTPDEKSTKPFALEIDYHNLKCILKGKYGKVKDFLDMTYSFSKENPEELSEMIFQDDYSKLSTFQKEGIISLDVLYGSGHITPQKIDVTMDQKMFDEIFFTLKKAHSKTIVEYYTKKVDFLNIETVFRGRENKMEEIEVGRMLLLGGKLTASELLKSFSVSIENFGDCFPGIYKPLAKILAEESGKKPIKFEQGRDNMLLGIFREKKLAPEEKMNGFLGYIVGKQFEMMNIRIVMVGLNNNLDKNVIRERLREVYV